jgi:alkylated DNA repair protein (DNA oxidative demethylase)
LPVVDHQPDLFACPPRATESVAGDVMLLRACAAPTRALVTAIESIAAVAPFRRLTTPGGGRMSVAMTNCGPLGWHSDARGYRYVECDPLTDRSWPEMPAAFRALASSAATVAGFEAFVPDACLINRYEPGARMGAHRDQDELDLREPIVSVSIGLPAVFLWYGPRRSGTALRVPLEDGDVLVWGRSARAGYHGVRPLALGHHPVSGALRYNLTFRRAR